MKNHFKLSPEDKNFILTLLLAVPYILYMGFIIQSNRGPVDYETFMEIGSRLSVGREVFSSGNFYPAPFVLLFSLLSFLPRPISMVLWLGSPVLAAWFISGKRPWVLIYGPLAAHFFGGQSSIFAMVGIWGFLRNRDLKRWTGGAWLGLVVMKPQLLVFPGLYACVEWLRAILRDRKVPAQTWGFLSTLAIWYLIGIPLGWDWPIHWLQNPRPVFFRAQAGILPRILIMTGLTYKNLFFWAILIAGFIGLVLAVRKYNFKRMPFDLWMFLGGCVNPLMHDYDLIQFIPLISTPLRRLWAVLASIPLWLVIIFFYTNDQAWFAVTLIPPILAAVTLYESRQQTKARI